MSATPEDREDNLNWSEFAMKWLSLFPFIPHLNAPVQCRWKLGKSPNTFSADYQRAEAPFRSDLEAAIYQMTESGNRVEVSPEVQYFLGVRANTIQQFLFFLSAAHEGVHQTIIPFPSLGLLKVTRWLMIDWWNTNGPKYAALLRLYDIVLGHEDEQQD